MTKMAAMPIYGKNLSRIGSPMILKLGMYHRGLKRYKVYVNNDPCLTLTYLMARSNWVTYTFEWEKLLKSNLMEENLQQRIILLMKNTDLNGVVCPYPEAIYMYITIIFKHL